MLDQFFHKPHVFARLESSPLRECFRPFVGYLHRRGHSSTVIQVYVQAVEHFGRWLGTQRRSIDAVDRQLVRRFLTGHLPRCHCATPAPTCRITVRAALNHLLRLPRSCPAPEPTRVPTCIDVAVEHFVEHLRDTCGLTASTYGYRARYTREFLHEVFGGRPLRWSLLRPHHVQSFVAAYARRCRPGSAQVAASSLRSFLRWLQLGGHCPPSLIAAVPHIPQWKLAHVPKFMTDEQLRQFLDGFQHGSATDRRDYALAVCLVDLGLRVSEVAALLLEDIDWRRATLRLHGTKERRVRELPLPQGVGQALAEYLRHDRPHTDSRHIFVRHRAPLGMPVSTAVIRGVMRRAYRKLGGGFPWSGTHVLRHTAATRMQRAGASLKEIADVLGHRSLDTTAIYAKVDLEQLSRVALPWPEVQP